MPETDPFEKFAQLATLLGQKVAELGLEQVQFQPIIDTTGSGRHLISVMFILDGPLNTEPEAESVDPEFDAMIGGILEATAEDETRRAEQERQQLHELAQAAQEDAIRERAQRAMEMKSRLHQPGKGFLDD